MSATSKTGPLGIAGRFAGLHGHRFISLTTFRASGAPVATPVWFALEGDSIFVVTEAASGKVKRIRRRPEVQVAPSTARGITIGPAEPGRARVVGSAGEAAALAALRRKYGWQLGLAALVWRIRRRTPVFLEITPG